MVSLYLHAYIRNNTKQSSRWLHIARNNRIMQQHEMLMPHDDPALVCSANDLPHLNPSYDSGVPDRVKIGGNTDNAAREILSQS